MIRTASGHLQMGVRRQIREVKDIIYAYIHNTVPSYFLSTILKIARLKTVAKGKNFLFLIIIYYHQNMQYKKTVPLIP